MIYGSATIHEVPWEVVVKDFRSHLGSGSYQHVGNYASQFFDFVRGHTGLFPDTYKTSVFMNNIVAPILHVTAELNNAFELNAGPVDADAYEATAAELLQTARALVPQDPITNADIDATIASRLDSVRKQIEEHASQFEVLYADRVAGQIGEAAIRRLLARYTRYSETTGVVVGGYGSDDYFPSFEVFECHGFIDSKLIAVRDDGTCRAIDVETPAAIEPFATTSMINTFRMGIGPDVFGNVIRATEKALHKFAIEVRDRIAPEAELPDLEKLISETVTEHRRDWYAQTLNKHYQPLARVIGVLPLPDMAALAKSLIELQSLKERVTTPSESVGGPIDVAAISKHDGFVWIERKHYFRPEINPRFLARQESR